MSSSPRKLNAPHGQTTVGMADGRPGPLTVSAVTALVKNALGDRLPATLHVVGQISNFKRHGSGHLYFTLKDEASELACVMWRSAAAGLPFKPTDGLEVVASGRVDVFERAGRYQLYVRKLEPLGVGALELAFRQLRQKLSAAGLFDPLHKKPLPKYPRRIAVVTSPTGAALRDILQTLARRWACAEVLICPVAVQGSGAAGQIAAAIARLNEPRPTDEDVDLMIVGRGGGSLEDLWAFNEEVVARAIFASRIPVISAVGHEVDVTIADLVADVRAATPTAAAELAAPDVGEVLALIERQVVTLVRCVSHRAELVRLALTGVLGRRAFADPVAVVRQRELVLDELTNQMERSCTNRLNAAARCLRRCEALLERIRPATYLLRVERALDRLRQRLDWATAQRRSFAERRLGRAAASLAAVSPGHGWRRAADRLVTVQRRLCQVLEYRVGLLRQRVDGEAARLSALSHKGTLRRGFTITRVKKTGRMVRDPAEVTDGTHLLTETAEGDFESRVINRDQLELFE